MKDLPLVSIVMVNYNGKHLLKYYFDSLFKIDYPKDKLEIFMVDNGSSDGSIDFVRNNFVQVKIIKNEINNYCKANNLGIESTKGKFVALVNNDVKFDKNWLIELINIMNQDKTIGMATGKILFPDGRIQGAGHYEFPNFYWSDRGFKEEEKGQYDKIEELNSISHCAVLYRKECFDDVGLLDEDFNMYVEDVDMSIRAHKKGWKLLYVPKSIAYHRFHGSIDEERVNFYIEMNRLLLIAKHYPEKLINALIGRGYFTVARDIQSQAGLYNILTAIILKLIKHHKKENIRNVLTELFEELKKISNYENSLLKDKVEYYLKTIESEREAIKEKDMHLVNLNLEINKRGQIIKDKNNYINNLVLEIENTKKLLNEKKKELENIYNSTAFIFIVRPLWAFLGNLKQILRGKDKFKSQNLQSKDLLNRNEKNNVANFDNIANTGNQAICTIISKNYLSYARVLTESFLEHNKGEVFVLLTDKIEGYFEPKNEKFTLIEIDAIKDRIPDFDKFCFQYNITELNTAVKPFFLEFLFEKYQLKKLIFFDPDILITHKLDDLFDSLNKFSIVLIPHITQPFPDNHKPSEIDILQSGVYNLGFIALSNTNSVKKLLLWWKDRLSSYCSIDFQKGLFVDQKWINLIPGFFDDIFILRDDSYNIAYWNLHYRKVYIEDGKILVNGRPAHFLHFSGFNPEKINSISKHQDRFSLKDLKYMKPIFELYRSKLVVCDYFESRNWPCVFNYFEDGVKIPDIIRTIYLEVNRSGKFKVNNPFGTIDRNIYLDWLSESINKKKPNIIRLMYEIYKRRLDIQNIYPNIFGFDNEAFLDWFKLAALHEYSLDDNFLDIIISLNEKVEREMKVGFLMKSSYKVRKIVKEILKPIVGTDVKRINRIRMFELDMYKKIGKITKSFIKKIENRNKIENKKGINVIGYLAAELGIGEGARANIKCLKSIGMENSLINISNHSYSRQNDLSFLEFSETNPYPINLIHVNADLFSLLFAEKGNSFFENKYNIGHWTWELTNFPDDWLSSFRYCDEIWVPSNFVLSSIAKKSPIPVLRMPYAVTINNLKNVNRSFFGLKDDEFVFLFIFDFFSFFERKNPLAIIKAFRQAFSPSEDVRLVIKCSNSNYDLFAMDTMKEAAKGLNITIIDKYLYRDEVNTLISLCDCYISLHRSEGFGLTMAEAMFLEKPVIATGYSGNCDFMNINNSYLVRYDLVQIEQDVGPYRKGCVWAEPNIEHAAELMRFVYKNKAMTQNVGKVASADIRKSLNFSTIGNEIKNRVDYLYNSIIR